MGGDGGREREKKGRSTDAVFLESEHSMAHYNKHPEEYSQCGGERERERERERMREREKGKDRQTERERMRLLWLIV